MASNQPALWIESIAGSTRIHLRVVVRPAGSGSLPAGRRNYSSPGQYPNCQSTNLPDSRWRNETVRLTWL